MPADGRRIYLAYGSNLHPQRLEARVGPVQLLGPVRLPGWSLRFNKRGGDGSAKANLHAAPGTRSVAFAAAYAMRLEQIGMLDVFEGCGRGYETFALTVLLHGEESVAFTYLAPSQWISSRLPPFDWYVDLIVSGARYHSFDQSYIEQIARQPARKDPDTARARTELSVMDLSLHAHYTK